MKIAWVWQTSYTYRFWVGNLLENS